MDIQHHRERDLHEVHMILKFALFPGDIVGKPRFFLAIHVYLYRVSWRRVGHSIQTLTKPVWNPQILPLSFSFRGVPLSLPSVFHAH
jgi:hypothetical protein